MQPPVEAIAAEYSRRYGVVTQIQYGGSGTLLSSLQIASTGDLYLAADETYLERARDLGLVAEILPVARMRPVIAVAASNPKGIVTIDDLLREDVEVALANPDAASVGKNTKRILTATGHWAALSHHARVFKPTVNDVANDVRLGAVDAGVIWDATANQYDGLDGVHVPEFDAEAMQITIGILRTSEHPTAALKFARYLGGVDAGLPEFEQHGYEPVAGDPWEESPELLVFSGAMLRPGLAGVISAFEEREGVTVNTVYNGCGILVAQMESGATPAAYVSCDTSFMEQVQDRFTTATPLTENDIVILVRKGNPHAVSSLADLARADLQVGLAHPENSALGALTKRMLEGAGLWTAVVDNRKLDAATGDFLVNQIRAGSLDAVVVYRSNAMANPANLDEHLDIVDVDSPGSVAVQPIATALDAKYPLMMRRFQDAVLSGASRDRFLPYGFRWIAETQ
ncbi:molybdate ABC transporter substrate-binding protein [Candidatus Poribacteria bacterium]|nr:molybdate ABC transporter substrate-binding protein [Candidatus Poribacteria bacterium]MBT5531859.1 molybdate ABC transporter substrate-binding protein [Candidatus Poribacteria bacterium]MBT5711709.1 molybdate ABC transporter substrate-binding protein [Candidatus Poribacteria bacterium]MBT7100854.1 molybdate ABC transporter substrate-binding protein [Candidatus Poribacteria bacterium]MBT7806343.1 molybdate ABC transporter substrate-binding protein [Candidatus Poribacteria bacterium]